MRLRSPRGRVEGGISFVRDLLGVIPHGEVSQGEWDDVNDTHKEENSREGWKMG